MDHSDKSNESKYIILQTNSKVLLKDKPLIYIEFITKQEDEILSPKGNEKYIRGNRTAENKVKWREKWKYG